LRENSSAALGNRCGASIFRAGLGILNFGIPYMKRTFRDRINRHCFNALNVYMDSGDIENPDAHIAAVAAHKWPKKHHWPETELAAQVSR